MSQLFTAPDTWHGGFYELAIELGPRSDERLQAALKVIWRDPHLMGCYERGDVEPSAQPRALPTLATLERGHLRGIATMPNGRQVACGTFAVREEDHGHRFGSDWIGLYLPMGALSTAYDVGAYPFKDEMPSRLWREPLDSWMVGIASAVFAAVPFPLALIGHEVSGSNSAEELLPKGIPEERWVGYLWREGERLAWLPPNRYEGDFDIG